MTLPFADTERALAADGGRATAALWGLALLGLLAWLGWMAGSRWALPLSTPQARLEVEAEARPLVLALAGTVTTAPPALGAAVRAGDVLLALDDREARQTLALERATMQGLADQAAAVQAEAAALARQAGDQLQTHQAASRQAAARVAEAEAQRGIATEWASRLQAEAQAGHAAAMEGLQARSDLQKAEAVHAALAAEAERVLADGRGRAAGQLVQQAALRRQAAALAAELHAAMARVERQVLAVERHRLRAPVDGVVADVAALHVGDHLREGLVAVTVLPAAALRIVAAFDGVQTLGRVRPGQAAALRLQAYPWTRHGAIQARVLRVAAEPRDGRLRVELQPTGTWPRGVPQVHGLAGELRVVVEETTPWAWVRSSLGLDLP